jgi:DpnII restriction endonuclease
MDPPGGWFDVELVAATGVKSRGSQTASKGTLASSDAYFSKACGILCLTYHHWQWIPEVTSPKPEVLSPQRSSNIAMEDVEIQLQTLRRPGANIWSIHYSCESWFEVADRPVAISSIAMVRLEDNSTKVFSQSDTKEEPEKYLLNRFYNHLRDQSDAILVHWNMHTSDFGFDAINNRYRFVTSEDPPYSPPESNRIDLDSLIARKFGSTYADHPKLSTLGALNGFSKRYMLSGKEEAKNFSSGNHGDIRRSTTEKAQLIAYILKLFLKNQLITNDSLIPIMFAGQRLDAIKLVEELGHRFEYVRRQLARRRENRPTIAINDEYDFQDLYHSLLRLFFDDIRQEEWTPEYAGVAARIDFVLPQARLAVELKHYRSSMSAISLSNELTIDSQRYSKHKDTDTLVCLVLDREGHIANPRGIERDLSKTHDGVRVVVRIIDR